MGCGMSTEEKEGKLRNEQIENTLKKDRMMQRNEIKMLLLGKYISLLRGGGGGARRVSRVLTAIALQGLVNLENRQSSSR